MGVLTLDKDGHCEIPDEQLAEFHAKFENSFHTGYKPKVEEAVVEEVEDDEPEAEVVEAEAPKRKKAKKKVGKKKKVSRRRE